MIRLQRKMIRRVQLCVLVSLLLHVWLGLVLHQRYIALVMARQEAEAARRLVEEDPRLIVPEYHWENIERPESRHTFEEPVATEAPKATEPEPIDAQAARARRAGRQEAADGAVAAAAAAAQSGGGSPGGVDRAAPGAAGRRGADQPPGVEARCWSRTSRSPNRRRRLGWKRRRRNRRPPRRTSPAVANAPRHEREMSESAPAALAKQDAMKLARRAAPSEPLPEVADDADAHARAHPPADVAQTERAAPPPTAPASMPPAPIDPGAE